MNPPASGAGCEQIDSSCWRAQGVTGDWLYTAIKSSYIIRAPVCDISRSQYNVDLFYFWNMAFTVIRPEELIRGC